jgi:hypothetical protein
VFSGDFGQNTINNFDLKGGNHDTIQLAKSEFADFAAVIANTTQNAAGDAVITNPLNHTDTLTLSHVSVSQLESHPSDFFFV